MKVKAIPPHSQNECQLLDHPEPVKLSQNQVNKPLRLLSVARIISPSSPNGTPHGNYEKYSVVTLDGCELSQWNLETNGFVLVQEIVPSRSGTWRRGHSN